MNASTLDLGCVLRGLRSVARRAGRWGFWFFLAKGLAWLALPWLAMREAIPT